MKSKKCEDDAMRIVHICLNNNKNRKSTMKHIEYEGCNMIIIQRVLKYSTDTTRGGYSKRSDPQPFVLTGNQLKKIKNYHMRSPNIS